MSAPYIALAAAAMALANFSQLYGDLRFRYALHDPSFYLPHVNLQYVTLAAAGLGFLLAGIGFWIASAAVEGPDAPKGAELVESAL